ncbi:MAG: YIP1 family protein [Acidobacteriia bacterium]|nr:YIP1 family protein [Terriglobia bacterium]
MASATTPTAEAPERINSFGRIFGALFSPKATFESIVRRPSWLLPTMLLCVLVLGVVGIFSYRGGWPSFFQKQMAGNSRIEQMPPEQRERVYEAQLKYGPKVAYVQGVLAPFILVIVVAAVFLGVFSGLMGAKFNFKTSLGITSHAFMPGLISGLLGILIVSVKDPTTIDLQNIVASNAGAFLSSDSPKWMSAMLGSIDVFSFWNMTLLAIGYHAAAPKKLSSTTAFFSIFALWLVYVLIRTGLTAAFA